MDYLEGFVTTIGHLAWPLTAITLAYFTRNEIRNVVAALAERIKDKGSDVSITKEGVAIKTVVAAQEARITSLQVEQEQVKSLALNQMGLETPSFPAAGIGEGAPSGMESLRVLAENYMNVNLPDWAQRTRAKDEVAQKMAFLVLQKKVDRDVLAAQQHEGMVIALASAILLAPEPKDAARLLAAGFGAKRLHVRYRVLASLTKLVNNGLVSGSELERTKELLKEYELGADASLLRQVSNVRSLIEESSRP